MTPATQTLDPPAADQPEATRHTHADRFPELENIQLIAIDRSRNHRIARPGDEQRILDLMRSIEASGQLQPVRVYRAPQTHPNRPDAKLYILGFGWRRTEAMARLGYELVRAEVFPAAPDHEIEAARAIENIHRQDITPVEEAQAVADILTAYTSDHPAETRQQAIEHAAAETGRSVSWVRDRDYFARLTNPVRELAIRCGLPAGHLRELAKIGDASMQLSIAAGAVHLGTHLLKPGTLEPQKGKWEKEQLARFWEQVEGGEIHREPIQTVKRRVEECQRSLKSVPWSLTLPVSVAGGGAMPACDNCPHNTANDQTLFGIEPGETTHALCMSPSCFKMKTEASDREREKLVKQLARTKAEPTPQKFAAKLAAAPGWLDEQKLKGYLKRNVTKARAQAKDARATSASSQRNGHQGRRLTPHEEAIKKFGDASDTWCENARDLIAQLAGKKACREAALLLLQWASCIDSIAEVRVPYISVWNAKPQTDEPSVPAGLSEEAVALVKLATSDKPAEVVKIAGFELVEYGPEFGMLKDNPPLLTALIKGFGGNLAKLGSFPSWDDFKPAAEPAAPKKKAARKKVTKKKSAKKKVSKRGASK